MEECLMAQYNYPNAKNNPNAAIPVYIVAPPVLAPGVFPPNKQNNPLGAIPVNFVPQPTSPNALDAAIPVLIVAGPGVPDSNGRWPSNQRNINGAIPVYNSLTGMPVWSAVPGLAPPIVINADFYTNTSLGVGQDIGTVTAYNSPTSWSILSGNPNGNMFVINYAGRLILFNGPIAVGLHTLTVQATNADGAGQGTVTIQCLLRK